MSEELKRKGHLAWVKAFTIFAKYEPDETFTLQPAHDVIYSCGIEPDDMSDEDVETLESLGWSWDSDDLECWMCFT